MKTVSNIPFAKGGNVIKRAYGGIMKSSEPGCPLTYTIYEDRDLTTPDK